MSRPNLSISLNAKWCWKIGLMALSEPGSYIFLPPPPRPRPTLVLNIQQWSPPPHHPPASCQMFYAYLCNWCPTAPSLTWPLAPKPPHTPASPPFLPIQIPSTSGSRHPRTSPSLCACLRAPPRGTCALHCRRTTSASGFRVLPRC